MRKHIYLSVLGGAVCALGVKLAQVYWLDFEWPHPNFIDGITAIMGGLTLLIMGFKGVIKWTSQRK